MPETLVLFRLNYVYSSAENWTSGGLERKAKAAVPYASRATSVIALDEADRLIVAGIWFVFRYYVGGKFKRDVS